MKAERRKEDVPAGKATHTERSVTEAPGQDENCRCKETSKKSIPELLKVVISDLSFWKKTK